MGLRQRIELVEQSRDCLGEMSVLYHYMHKQVHPKSCPFGWSVRFDDDLLRPDGHPAGFIVFASIHFIKMKGEFGYPGLPTRWQVLSLARLWLHDDLPQNSETVVIAKALKMVQRRWLQVHPPRFPDQPFHILKILAYSDTRYHLGTIYKASNFREVHRRPSKVQNKNTRGRGQDGAVLICFAYDLKEPNWEIA